MSAADPNRTIYSRPPIVEAVIDIRCFTSPDLQVADLIGVREQLPDLEFAGEIEEVTEEFDFSGKKTRTEKKTGVVFASSGGDRRLQLQPGGLSYSILGHYTRWEDFRGSARQAWDVYSAVARPFTVGRVGVRYINRIHLEGRNLKDIAAILKVRPEMPWKFELPNEGYFLQVTRDLGDHRMIINEQTIRNINTDDCAVILDLDAFSEKPLTVSSNDEHGFLWNVVEVLHVSVENAFEDSIEERVRERIK